MTGAPERHPAVGFPCARCRVLESWDAAVPGVTGPHCPSGPPRDGDGALAQQVRAWDS